MLNFKTKDLLSVTDLSRKEIIQLLELTSDIKKNWIKYTKVLKYWRLGLLFEIPLTRTRVSFEMGFKELGGNSIFLKLKELKLNRGESVVDSAKSLERYLDFIAISALKHSVLQKFADNTSIPIINALSDLYSPCQVLGDVFTMYEKKKKLNKIAYIGDGNNVCNSLMLISSILGLNLIVATPKDHEPNEIIQDRCKNILIINDPVEAAKEADVIYTNNWISSYQKFSDEKVEIFKSFQINEKLVKLAKDDYLFMHCLPAYRSQEVTKNVIESNNSIIYDQAENRLHIQKGILIGLKTDEFRGYKTWF